MGQLDTCSYVGCDKPKRAKGFCATHWTRLHKYGDVNTVKSNKGFTPWHKGLSAEKTPRWKGDKATYTPKHAWLTRHYSHLKKACTQCGATDCRLEWANISGDYKREVTDYAVLCVSCHRKMDLKKTHCPQGHELIGNNLKILKNGWRRCRTCDVTRTREYRAKLKMSKEKWYARYNTPDNQPG